MQRQGMYNSRFWKLQVIPSLGCKVRGEEWVERQVGPNSQGPGM